MYSNYSPSYMMEALQISFGKYFDTKAESNGVIHNKRRLGTSLHPNLSPEPCQEHGKERRKSGWGADTQHYFHIIIIFRLRD